MGSARWSCEELGTCNRSPCSTKFRLALTPMANQWRHVPLYLTARGLTTSPIPYFGRTFQMDVDLVDHQQAEFLVADFFPWSGFHEIGCQNPETAEQVTALIAQQNHRPKVSVKTAWYY